MEEGDRIGTNLIVERELGSGAMGTVWLARNETLGSHVAVKVLQQAPSAVALERFMREARGLAKLHHPHIVRVYDCGTAESGEPFVVMELLRGEDLASKLEKTPVLPVELVVEIVSQVCKALSAVAPSDVVHRDIKPANLFLLAGDDVFVKVLDFGVARFEREGAALTRQGTVIGTPLYMSPEQFGGSKAVDQRSDLWSLAVVAYECITGAPPFVAESTAGLALAISRGEYLAPSFVDPALPAELDAFFARALSVDVDKRFQTPRELSSALTVAARAPVSSAQVAPIPDTSRAPASTVQVAPAVDKSRAAAAPPMEPRAPGPPPIAPGTVVMAHADTIPQFGAPAPAPVVAAPAQHQSPGPRSSRALGIGVAVAGIGVLGALGLYLSRSRTIDADESSASATSTASAAPARSARKKTAAPKTAAVASAAPPPAPASPAPDVAMPAPGPDGYLGAAAEQAIPALRKAAGESAQLLTISFGVDYVTADVRIDKTSKVRRYTLTSSGLEGPEAVSGDYVEGEAAAHSFDMDRLDAKLVPKIVEDAAKRAPGFLPKTVTVDRYTHPPEPAMRVHLEDAEDRTTMIDYDMTGRFIQLTVDDE